jgi:hypothetical protein
MVFGDEYGICCKLFLFDGILAMVRVCRFCWSLHGLGIDDNACGNNEQQILCKIVPHKPGAP